MPDIDRLIDALRRIADYEFRADRRRREMVDISELYDMQRIARKALEYYLKEK